MTAQRRIQKFLTRMKERHGSSVEIILFQVTPGGKKISVSSEKELESIDEVTNHFYEEAVQNASALGGILRFIISVYGDRTTDPERATPLGSIAFTVEQAASEDGDVAVSHPASLEGLLAQLMHHNAELYRINNGSHGVMLHHMARQIEMYSEEIQRLRSERETYQVNVEALSTRKHERDMEMEKTKQDNEIKKDMYQRFMLGAVPMLINKFFGQEIVRQVDTPFEATASSFLQSIIQSGRIDKLAESGLLAREEILLLITMAEQLQKRYITAAEKQRQQEVAKAAVVNDPVPPAQAAR